MKKILLSVLGAVLLLPAFVVAANYVYFEKGASTQTGLISGQADSEFVAETAATSDYLEFSFTPKTAQASGYYISFSLMEDGNVLASGSDELRQAVSKADPIVLGVGRKPEASYSLEMKIKASPQSSDYLHNDKIVIQPSGKR